MFRINSTLLTKLFFEPAPQPSNPDVLKLYRKVFYRMFPGKDDFISFLQMQNHDSQYMIAEKIIHHLCYVSNYPPSFFALKDVICIEDYQKDHIKKDDKYIPRDHFIHLVYLYMLGIYVFFY